MRRLFFTTRSLILYQQHAATMQMKMKTNTKWNVQQIKINTQFELLLYRIKHHLVISFTATTKVTYACFFRCYTRCGWLVSTGHTETTQRDLLRSWSFLFFFTLSLWNECAHDTFWSVRRQPCVRLYFMCVYNCEFERKLNLVCSYRSLEWIRYWFYWKL